MFKAMIKKLCKLIIILTGCTFSFVSFAQIKVTFLLDSTVKVNSIDSIFIAGNFNNWNPHDHNYQLIDNNGKRSVSVTLPQGNYEYKMTKGSWDNVETLESGKQAGNRNLILSGDTSILIKVKGWNKITSSTKEIKHSASANVKVLDSAFFIPQLSRYRRIWIYLPPTYNTSTKRYPVLYMHDGQNLFDNATSYSGEWGVDEFLDSMSNAGKKEVIVIGIDNGQDKRMNEYNPWEFQQFGKGEGDQYVDFLVQTLKPAIDQKYRTKKDKKNTYIAGSSMGGLISFYAALKYPQVYGGAGIFSPAFWTAPKLIDTIDNKFKKLKVNMFFYAGGKEGKSMIPDMKKIERKMVKCTRITLIEIIDPAASHNENAWKKWFPSFYEAIILH